MNYKITTIIFAFCFTVTLVAFILANIRAEDNMKKLVELSTAVKNSKCFVQKSK